MLESTGGSKPRDALLEKLRERIKDRDRALEVNSERMLLCYTIHCVIHGTVMRKRRGFSSDRSQVCIL